MKVISSIHTYNHHLFISYLNEGIRIIPFSTLRESFNMMGKTIVYPNEIKINHSLEEIITTQSILVGINNFTISSFSLLESSTLYSHDDIFAKYIASQLSFDSVQKKLYILTEQFGIVNLNFYNPSKLRHSPNNGIIPKSFEELGAPTVSNMIIQDKSILLSIRGFGISKINNTTTSEEIYRTEDAQDVLYMKDKKLIIVADAIDGVILFINGNQYVEKKISLPNNDFPKEIKQFYKHILIKGKYGLYLYNLRDNKLQVIQEGRIGAVTHFHNYIIYSQGNRVNFLVKDKKSLLDFELKDKGDLEVEHHEYLHYK